MQRTSACVFAALAYGSSASANEANPLGKVIELMDSLTAKIVKEGEDEAKAYKEFFEWCDDAARNLKQEIQTSTTRKEKLEAAISKHAGDIEASTAKIGELAASINGDDTDLRDATLIREKEAKDYAANEAELMDVIDTLGRASSIIQREMAKNPAAFAQLDTSSLQSMLSSFGAVLEAAAISNADKQKLTALVQSQQSADDDEPGAPAAAVYKTHSTGILDVIEDLKEKAEGQLSDLRKAESNTKHNFQMLKQSLEDQVAADTKAKNDEASDKAASEGAKAAAEADLAQTNKDLENANASLSTASSDCMQTAADHQATVAARDEELKVIAQARKILTDTSSGAVEQTYSLLQMKMDTRADLAGAEVVTLVRRLAKQEHSAALAQLASRVGAILRYGASAGEDPFVKVRGLISDMISKLEAEAHAEASEKAYCDEQIAKTEEKKGELEEDIAKLSSKINIAAARSAGLKEDVKELQAELAALAKLQAEMDKIRIDSHAAYVEAKADLELGLDGVRKALSVLRDYYGSSAALLQSAQPPRPELHSKATGAGDSIIGILEVVESDFATNLAKEETEEADAESEYQKTTQENKITKTLKDQDVKYKTQEFTGLDKQIAELTSDRESTDAELAAVNDYYSKIKERCIAKPETYEERQRRRSAEIAGLKEALAILNDETAFVQRRKSGLRGHFLGL